MMINGLASNNVEIEEFLEESNAIEREYSDESLEDAQKAWDYAYQNHKKITVDYILEIHHKLLHRLDPAIAGTVRNCIVYIGGRVCPEKTRAELLQELQDWIDTCKPKGKKATEKEIKKWHVDFEHIHPFQDGNGRTGRILWQIQRLKNDLPIRIIHIGQEQAEYYKWFR